MPELSIDIQRGPDSVTVTLSGSVDTSTLAKVVKAFQEVIDSSRDPVHLNLYECEYLDDVSLLRILQFQRDLREFVRPFSIFVRPMSFVSYRARQLPISSEVPSHVSQQGETRLAERRMSRLKRWRREKPIKNLHPPGIPEPTQPPTEVEVEVAEEHRTETELVPIDFTHVSVLAGKDERVVKRIWETYCQFLDTGGFKEAADGLADTQLSMDARMVAQSLRLDPVEVRKVIESVSTHLMEILEPEEGESE